MSSAIIPIFTKEGVPPIGPYSQAVKAQGLVWVSGQMAADNMGELIAGTVAEKAHQICNNAKVVLEAAGSGLDKVVKVTIFFADLDDFGEFNQVYAEYFPHKPARSSLEAKRLPAGVTLEMELVALA
ncbi:Endoribonuclease L-PSP/chorismate mutase-like protein [Rhexocercosporidium sp. MPI-PUGE-AT-0058]|nr:Endoribonuclease L-PSP/chorismate mutase-like protein [Rhexocercosporidium sp. MPI-PUGE-AT-0058]